ncbi:CRISPR-associated endonuclease Cas1 [Desulfotruncus alcoholivorax]|uniref:CRISPR-associated endonuclease Cas1 n=1 Tax=Desulfotruncus alcoholivorax TaxID=265477 RepID=UPI0004157302|nr:CRISPR-associated endonuclease Cas1 [Desulfotruncus alcoholivorax]
MSFLYVCEPDTRIRIEEGRIIAEKSGGLVVGIPMELLERVVLMGSAQMTASCSAELLKKGIPVTFLSKTGVFYGRLESTKHVNITRQREQFRAGEDEDFCVKFSAGIVAAKIHNQVVILRRYNRHIKKAAVDEHIYQMSLLENAVSEAKAIPQIMGYEGAASRHYFSALSMMVNKNFSFSGRNRMPPLDPFNSLLSLGYTLLLYETYTALVNKGLHPYAGLMHQDRQGHPALASDLMEEWRPVIVDSLVMSIVQGGSLVADDFNKDEETGAVLLKKNTLRKFVKYFEQKIRSEANYLNQVNYRMSYRRAIQYQAGVLANCIENRDITIYHPVRLR